MDDFLANRPTIEWGHQPTAGAKAASGAAATDALPALKGQNHQVVCEAEGARPRVETVAEDGVVKRVVITCSDGQRIELRCVYDG
ncbi:MAG: hypothetical protein E1N59_102 [Puniceicoccaceae bacterium 5H]|nr:MAG: hypothetical protein E1N59_102 [Puniceicoccaceae bacterium 5H]